MAVIAGIDEAGYGPILGPLVVSMTAFEVPDDLLERSLWSPLRRAVTARVSKRDTRLPIVDSKKLHTPSHGLAALERTALTMLASGGDLPQHFGALLGVLCPRARAQLAEYPWYDGFDPALPLDTDATLIAIKANAVSHAMRSAGVRFLGAACRVVPAGHFNRLVQHTRNKATVLWSHTLQLIEQALDRSEDRRVRVVLDRQGARIHVAQALMTAFDVRDLRIVAESGERSAYRLHRAKPDGGVQDVTVEFVQSGESRHLPIALASIYSKYLREVCMLALNRYWQQHVDPLERTAGYYQDGHRFLRDIEPAVRSLAIDRDMLVRSR